MTLRKKSKKTTTALTKWEEELAKAAEAAVEQEANTGGGQFFSIRSGVLSLNDSPLPGNEMAVVIIDFVMENTYYDREYDPDDPGGPMCFAFGRSDESMKPHANVTDPGAPTCEECPHNEWGSADKGRGKACRNRRRLALIPAGTLTRGEYSKYGEGDLSDAQVAYLVLPPTSVNGFGAYVKKVANTLRRPPHAVVTRVAVVPDERTQLKVTFELIAKIEGADIGVVMQRHDEESDTIEFPYQMDTKPKKTEAPPVRGRRNKTKRGRR